MAKEFLTKVVMDFFGELANYLRISCGLRLRKSFGARFSCRSDLGKSFWVLMDFFGNLPSMTGSEKSVIREVLDCL